MPLTNFKNYLKLNVDSPNSQVNYLSQVRCFFKQHDEYNQENINAYLAKRLDTLGKQTFNVTVSAFKQYGKFIKLELEMPNLKYISKSEKDFLTEEELLNELIPYFGVLFERQSHFYSFVVRFLFYTGLRPIEMCKLLTKDVSLENNILIIRSPKDKEDKKVPYPNVLKDDIKKYLQTDNTIAFNICYSSIKHIFKKLTNDLKYKKKINPYMLRHGYAHYCLDNGVPIEKLQILMGHSDLRTTMIYCKPRVEDALNSYFDKIKPKGK